MMHMCSKSIYQGTYNKEEVSSKIAWRKRFWPHIQSEKGDFNMWLVRKYQNFN